MFMLFNSFILYDSYLCREFSHFAEPAKFAQFTTIEKLSIKFSPFSKDTICQKDKLISFFFGHCCNDLFIHT